VKIPIRGIIHVTGESDVGKTTFALQCGAKIPRIAFFDGDIKGSAVVENLRQQGAKFGMYQDLVAKCKGMREIQRHEYCLGLVQSIKAGQFDAIIWDNYALFESTFQPFVRKNAAKFREFYSPKGDIKGSEIWLSSFDYEAQILAYMTTLAPLVVIVSHLKNHNINGKRTGKLVPDSKRPLVRKSILRLWLRHNPEGAVPIGLVLKRIGKDMVLEDGTYDKVNVLPRRIVPAQGDKSLWDVIAQYWEVPMGNRKPLLHEVPNEFELSILDGTLTEDQKMIFRYGKVETDELLEFDDNKAKVLELKAEGMSIPKISRELGIKMERVAQLLEEE
jgi:hypothetical protein